MPSSRLEFMVENISNAEKLKSSLLNISGISKAEVVRNEIVLIETELPCNVVNDIVQDISGTRAVLQGFGEGGAAVAIIEGTKSKGVVRLSSAIGGNGGLVDGTIDGLSPGDHFLNIHVAGDISQGCDSLGPVWEPTGMLGKITAGTNGRANFKFVVPNLQIGQIVGRSLAITTPHHSKKIACGVIARSAGLFENSKKMCACDGITLWDERNVPAVGQGRRQNINSNRDNQEAKL